MFLGWYNFVQRRVEKGNQYQHIKLEHIQQLVVILWNFNMGDLVQRWEFLLRQNRVIMIIWFLFKGLRKRRKGNKKRQVKHWKLNLRNHFQKVRKEFQKVKKGFKMNWKFSIQRNKLKIEYLYIFFVIRIMNKYWKYY